MLFSCLKVDVNSGNSLSMRLEEFQTASSTQAMVKKIVHFQ
jgi:hypothetical protein